MDISQLFKNNRSWVNDRLEKDENYFRDLSKGQSPKLLYFGCSDSRVIPEKILGLEPGDAFVHRNISNLFSESDPSSNSVLQYAIENLNIVHIVVCGHYGCGGIDAAIQKTENVVMNLWLKSINQIIDEHQKELDLIDSKKEKQNRLVELNVLEQCKNIQNSAILNKISNSKKIHIYGWVFDINVGKIKDLKFNTDN